MAGVNGNFNFNHNFFVGIKKGEKTGRPEKEDRIDKRAEEKTEEKRPQVDVRPQVSASDVLSFMQNSSVIMSGITAAKQINPAKYVTTEQREAISESMKSFEKAFTDKFDKIVEEFPRINHETAMKLATRWIEDEI